MTHSTPGTAYLLWLRVTELSAELGLNKTRLEERSGVRKATLDGWRTSKRKPQARTVMSVVEAINRAAEEAGRDLYLSRDDALRLAGIVPSGSIDDVRAAIRSNQSFTEAQRSALLQVVDSFAAQNAQPDEDHPP